MKSVGPSFVDTDKFWGIGTASGGNPGNLRMPLSDNILLEKDFQEYSF